MSKLLSIKGFDKYFLDDTTDKVISFHKDEVNGKEILANLDGNYRLWRNKEPEQVSLARIKYLANVQRKLSKDLYIVAIVKNNGTISAGHSLKTYNKESAIKEAERLAIANPYDKFGILKLEGICKSRRVTWERQ